jgi:fibronectin-binding autotransporter adhesin
MKDGASVTVMNSNAISLGNGVAITLGSSGPAPGGSAANAPVVVETTTNGSAGPGQYGDGSNTIDIGSNSTILINRNASIIANGTQNTSEAINPYGFGDTIINYGLIQGGPSAAIWFQNVGPANSPRNVLTILARSSPVRPWAVAATLGSISSMSPAPRSWETFSFREATIGSPLIQAP